MTPPKNKIFSFKETKEIDVFFDKTKLEELKSKENNPQTPEEDAEVQEDSPEDIA